MKVLTKEVATLTGVSVRTLHHYDKLGLLTPKRQGENGYRHYSQEDVDTLQQILFFKACGFSLKAIKNLLENPNFNKEEAFRLQIKALTYEKEKIEGMINTIYQSLAHVKGEKTMTNEEKFKAFDFSHNPYEEEARKRWGDKAVDESNRRINHLKKEEKEELGKNMEALFTRLASLMEEGVTKEEVDKEIDEMYRHFNKHFGSYTLEAFKGLGQMYVQDERFTKNLNKVRPGLAAFLAEAMGNYVDKRIK